MSLRYIGVPDRGVNRQVDDMPSLCFCKFVAVGQPMDDSKCEVHDGNYACDQCHCTGYRPSRKNRAPSDYPLCVCGHIAQEHN